MYVLGIYLNSPNSLQPFLLRLTFLKRKTYNAHLYHKTYFLMIPTFLAISLIVFAIVNFAQIGARQMGSEGGQQANTGEQRNHIEYSRNN